VFELGGVYFARDDYPGAQILFEMEKKVGPQVVVDGSVSYSVHFPEHIPQYMRFTLEGLDQ